MNNLDFEHRLTEGQFQNVVRLIREKGGTVDGPIIVFDGVRAGYHMQGDLMKLHVEDTAVTQKMAKEHGAKGEPIPLMAVIMEAIRIPVASYPVYAPEPTEPDSVEESDEQVLLPEEHPDMHSPADAEHHEEPEHHE